MRPQTHQPSDSNSLQKKADEAMEWVTIHLRKSQNHLDKLVAVVLLLSASSAGMYLTRPSRS
ncbi:hypothetical protein DPMN_134945 [Dreissena polymorpha]|uniref:Uncharacterized protein n=1 Tax=Dreissena polymorpha TaxID=45954 RepID=A0A9D4FY35_DREPO|nr:hypothetical protein DPMN_134945 [Dreissena polymorpha]